jgi:hypothetical protein
MQLSQYAQPRLTCILRRLAYDVWLPTRGSRVMCNGSNIKRVGVKTGSKVAIHA